MTAVRAPPALPFSIQRTKPLKQSLPSKKEDCPVVLKKTRVENSPESKSEVLLFTQNRQEKDYLEWVSDLVSKKCRHNIFELKKPAGATLKIGPLKDTIYSGEHKVVNEWGKFYLPEIVRMQVVGVVEGTSCPSDELVLMTCEDEKLYAYDGEELHLVASDLKQLVEEGISYPASKTYYKGEAFRDMTEEYWAKVWKSPTGMRLKQAHHEQVQGHKAKCLEYLKATAARRGLSVPSFGPTKALLLTY
ncbi:uncharacterized protein LOC134874939 isoform X2 [Eleginops maclovinus]|uniref:uncharacterized protein LOC134874939 isoform X2 n=1 Tax=Eleginops maclovinus TaxID=56733 RepID=UPI00308050C0